MVEKRGRGRPKAQPAGEATAAKKDTRAKRTYRIDAGIARRYEAHCVLKGNDTSKTLESILSTYLGGSYWVDKTRDSASETTAHGETQGTPTGQPSS